MTLWIICWLSWQKSSLGLSRRRLLLVVWGLPTVGVNIWRAPSMWPLVHKFTSRGWIGGLGDGWRHWFGWVLIIGLFRWGVIHNLGHGKKENKKVVLDGRKGMVVVLLYLRVVKIHRHMWSYATKQQWQWTTDIWHLLIMSIVVQRLTMKSNNP